MPVAVFVGSDGIDDCFNNDRQLNTLYRTILYSFATSEFDDAVAELEDYLPRLSAKGSGDDVSIAGILDFDSIHSLDIISSYGSKIKATKEEVGQKSTEDFNSRKAPQVTAEGQYSDEMISLSDSGNLSIIEDI